MKALVYSGFQDDSDADASRQYAPSRLHVHIFRLDRCTAKTKSITLRRKLAFDTDTREERGEREDKRQKKEERT